MKNIIVIMGLVSVAAASSVWAEEGAAGVPVITQQKIDEHLQNQEKRIQDGVKEGRITPEDAKKLEKREEKIKQVEAKALADGKIDKKEAHKLRRMERRADRAIKRKAKLEPKTEPKAETPAESRAYH